jgi:hypothetical protein
VERRRGRRIKRKSKFGGKKARRGRPEEKEEREKE